jgi:hypothetical protein
MESAIHSPESSPTGSKSSPQSSLKIASAPGSGLKAGTPECCSKNSPITEPGSSFLSGHDCSLGQGSKNLTESSNMSASLHKSEGTPELCSKNSCTESECTPMSASKPTSKLEGTPESVSIHTAGTKHPIDSASKSASDPKNQQTPPSLQKHTSKDKSEHEHTPEFQNASKCGPKHNSKSDSEKLT